MELLGLNTAQMSLWLLFLMRTAGFIFVAPLFSAKTAPPQFRLVLTFLLTAISFIAWAPRMPVSAEVITNFTSYAVSELILGLMMGFIVGMVFVVFQFGGQFIGYQMGFAIVNVLDPQSQTQVSLIGQFMFAVSVLAFLAMNLHHQVIMLWYRSYEVAPVGQWSLYKLSALPMQHSFDDLFFLALKIALPLLAFLILTDLSLGIVARVMPQMNVFIVGIPLKISMGMLFLSFVVLGFDPVLRQTTTRFVDHAAELLYFLVK